jgi:hypothetical protein
VVVISLNLKGFSFYIKDYSMNIDEITYNYYSHWTGNNIAGLNKGIHFIYNPDRDNIPKGYSQPHDIYVFLMNDRIILSYGTRVKEKIKQNKDKINETATIEYLKSFLENTFLRDVGHNIKYVYKNSADCRLKVEILKPSQYELFFEFFKGCNPNCGAYSWVEEYYLSIVSKNHCHGIIVDNKLVSATDSPDMPYMQELVQEIGINTLKEYRGKGYARAACISLIHTLLSKNMCPMWSTDNDNIASDRLARSVGFEKLADVLSMTISG